jgi:hypothetical protein
MIWDNTYEPQTAVNRYQLTLFSQTEDGLYERAEELHQQRAYTVETIKALIEQAGLTFVAAYDAFTHNPPTPTSERIYFIAREKEHAGKLYTS